MQGKRRRGRVTAAELMSELNADPQFQAMWAAKNKDFARRAAQLRMEEEPLTQDLRTAGFPVASVWDLVNSPNTYGRAVPTLLHHLGLAYSDPIREGIARALAMPDAKPAWSRLVSEFRQTSSKRVKDGLAVALAALASEQTLEELFGLLTDPSHGPSRLLLLSGVWKRRSSRAREIIEELSSDPLFAKEIASRRKRRLNRSLSSSSGRGGS